MNTYKEITLHITSGDWVDNVCDELGLGGDVKRALRCRYEELTSHQAALKEQEEGAEELARHRVRAEIEADPQKVLEYQRQGWDIKRRATRVLDIVAFMSDYDIPPDALSVTKSKLSRELKKEVVKYESITGYTFTVGSRYKREDGDN